MGIILMTRLNGSKFYLNYALIETLEETPDTHILLTNGNRYIVLESAKAIIEKISAAQAGVMRRAYTASVRKYLFRKTAERFQPLTRAGRKNTSFPE